MENARECEYKYLEALENTQVNLTANLHSYTCFERKR